MHVCGTIGVLLGLQIRGAANGKAENTGSGYLTIVGHVCYVCAVTIGNLHNHLIWCWCWLQGMYFMAVTGFAWVISLLFSVSVSGSHVHFLLALSPACNLHLDKVH